jgi:hypothetical protein
MWRCGLSHFVSAASLGLPGRRAYALFAFLLPPTQRYSLLPELPGGRTLGRRKRLQVAPGPAASFDLQVRPLGQQSSKATGAVGQARPAQSTELVLCQPPPWPRTAGRGPRGCTGAAAAARGGPAAAAHHVPGRRRKRLGAPAAAVVRRAGGALPWPQLGLVFTLLYLTGAWAVKNTTRLSTPCTHPLLPLNQVLGGGLLSGGAVVADLRAEAEVQVGHASAPCVSQPLGLGPGRRGLGIPSLGVRTQPLVSCTQPLGWGRSLHHAPLCWRLVPTASAGQNAKPAPAPHSRRTPRPAASSSAASASSARPARPGACPSSGRRARRPATAARVARRPAPKETRRPRRWWSALSCFWRCTCQTSPHRRALHIARPIREERSLRAAVPQLRGGWCRGWGRLTPCLRPLTPTGVPHPGAAGSAALRRPAARPPLCRRRGGRRWGWRGGWGRWRRRRRRWRRGGGGRAVDASGGPAAGRKGAGAGHPGRRWQRRRRCRRRRLGCRRQRRPAPGVPGAVWQLGSGPFILSSTLAIEHGAWLASRLTRVLAFNGQGNL